MTTLKEWLGERAFKREDVDIFLDHSRPTWAGFDHELGYVLNDCPVQDGLEKCFTLGHYDTGGERRCIQYRDRPCRINTYGNSFTQCHQVSDGETWQEYLAAHLGEPIRNYGIGGYGVHQAYRRMLRTETYAGAEYIVLYIWGDDHNRSLMPCRYLFIQGWFAKRKGATMFHATPWTHLAVDPEAGAFREVENQFSTPHALYELCDPDRVHEAFADNLIVQLAAFGDGATGVDTTGLRRLAEWAECPVDLGSSANRKAEAQKLFVKVAHRGSMYLLDKVQEYVARHDKKLLVVLGYPSGVVQQALEGKPRPDQVILDYLQEKGLRHFDILAKHESDYQAFKPDPEAYVNRYYIGHYSPFGNHFFAFAIKDEIVDWLDPKPVAYRHRGERAVQFDGYLPED